MEKVEGIVLRSCDYQERHRIITLFTPEGLFSLIVKNISRKNARLLFLSSLFCHAEYHYLPSRTELHRFCDGAILDEHLDLRQTLHSLQTAGSLASAILTSQLPGKPSPALFALYKAYHKRASSSASSLLDSFYLKLLRHEGLLNPSDFTSSEWPLLLPLVQSLNFSSLPPLSPSLSQKVHAYFHSHY